MKRTLLSLILCIAMGISYAAELNIYASGLKLHDISPENRKASISYFLNAPATAVEFQLLDANQSIVHTIPLNDHPGYLTKGQHNDVEIDLFGIPTGEYSWAIKATNSTSNASITRVSGTDKRFSFYSPAGMVVDNSYNSPHFGRIYVSESRHNKISNKSTVNRTTTQGIYIFGPDLTDVTSQEDIAYDGGVTWNEDLNYENKTEQWVYGMYAPARLAVDEEGLLYVCDNGAPSKGTSGIWRMNPANPSANFEEVLATNKRGTIYTRANSIAVSGIGEDRILYVIDNNASNTPVLKQFPIGNTTEYSSAGTALVTALGTMHSLNTLIRGIYNDFWIFQYRGQIDAISSIMHYNSDLELDYQVNNKNNQSLLPATNTNRRGVGALSPDGKLLAVHAEQTIRIFDVTYDANKVPSLANERTISGVTGSNVDCIAFDVANNIYFASATREYFYAYALPKNTNTHTTPAPSSQRITLAEPIPHIMAYNLDVKQNGKYYDFSFYANSNATSGKLLFYDNTDEYIGEINIEQAITKGNNTISLLTHELPEGNDMAWKLQLSGADNEAFGIVYESPTILQRAHAAIDNSPESDYFGRIYISNNGKDKGCYIYDYDYSDIRTKDMCGMTDITTSGRPAVDAEGYVYWADYGENHGGIYVMNPKTFETHPFFDGEKDVNGLWTNGGVEIGSSCSGASIYGSGANTRLFATSEDSGGQIVNDYAIYNIGQNDGSIRRTWDEAPTQRVELNDNMNANGNFTIVGTSRGAWLCQNRSDGTNGEGVGGARSLIFCGQDGITYYRSTEGYITGSQGAGMAVSADESKLAMVTGTGDIFLFDLNWTYDNTAGCELPDLILSKTYRTKFSYISSMHFDYAGNLVTMAGTKYGTKNAGSDDMRLVVFSTPTDNNTTTIPARKKLTVTNKVTLLDTDNNTDVLTTFLSKEKNASVFRSLTAGMYNTLCLPFSLASFTGTPLENATVWQYNGATVENEATNKEIFLNFEEVTAIEAGKPYLVEPATDIAAPMEFKDVTISTTDGSNVTQSAVTMHGILHPTELQANDKSILFLVANNNLAWANVTANMNGMRAYFKVNDPSLLSARTRAYIRREPTVTTDMENITTTETEIKKVIYNNNLYILRGDEVYTIQGTKVK